jgi:Ca2+-transporting ATPase
MNQIIGLNKKEVKQRLLSFGYNELPSEKPKNILRIAIEVFKEPMFILLVSCGLLYIIIGDVLEGSVLLASILIIISITFYHYQKTEKALNALKQLASPKVLVVREGKQIKVSGREIVPDDIVLLNEGDRISADGILIEGLNLSVDESILTGESIPVLKSIQSQADSNTEYLYSGTLVTQGHGMMKVIATGLKTEFGKIGISLLEIKDSSTRLQIEMKKLIKNLFLIIAILVVSCKQK